MSTKIETIIILALWFFLVIGFQPLHGSDSYIEVSPEISYGVMDNDSAWGELIPVRGSVSLSPDTILNGSFSYAFDVPRGYKPFGFNHHGWRIFGKLEQRIVKDVFFFYEVNVGNTVPGSVDVPYLQNFNYQRAGIKVDIKRFIF